MAEGLVDPFGRKLNSTVETRLDAFQHWFDKYGKESNVDPALLRAIARQESAGLPGAVSDTKVRGLMQLTQDTAKRFGIKDRTDPEQSVKGAAKYLRFLLDRYGGDLVKATLAYNSGEGHVDNRLANLGWARKEGRDYVKKILGVDLTAGYDPEKFKGGRYGQPTAVVQTGREDVVAPVVKVSGQGPQLSPFEQMFGLEEPTMGSLPQPGTDAGSPVMETRLVDDPETYPVGVTGGKPRVTTSKDMTPLERAATKVISSTAPAKVAVPGDTVIEEAGKPGTFEVAGAWWRQETVLGGLFGYGINRVDSYEQANGFNPWDYYKQNEVEFADIAPQLQLGAFDTAKTEGEFRDRVDRIRKELEDRELIKKGGWGGTALGMGASLLDVLTLIPGSKMAQGASRATRFGIGIRDGLAVAGVQELGLQGLQTQRTLEESMWNLGISAFAGGGLYALTRPGKVLAKDNPNNPLFDIERKAKDEPIGVLRAGDSTTSPSEVVGGADSVGAARVAEVDSQIARADQGAPGVLTKLLEPATTFVSKGTGPVSRSMYYTLGKAREVLQGLFDLGGSLTKGMAEGRPMQASAEDLMLDYMQGLKREVLDFSDTMKNVNLEIGANLPTFALKVRSDIEQATGGLVKGNPITGAMMQELVRRRLVRPWSGQLVDEDLAWLRQAVEERGLDFDQVFPILDKASFKLADNIHRNNEVLENKMVELGLLSKDKTLGREYGLPQLWNAEWIVENREQARRFFIEIFTEKPDEDWLQANYAMDAKAFNELPLTDPKRSDILRDWSGDEYNRQLTMATADLEAAERNMKTAMEVMRTNLKQAGVAETEARGMTAKAALAKAKAIEAKAALARLGAYGERVEWATERAARLKAEADLAAARAAQAKLELPSNTGSKEFLEKMEASLAKKKAAGEDTTALEAQVSKMRTAVEARNRKLTEEALAAARNSEAATGSVDAVEYAKRTAEAYAKAEQDRIAAAAALDNLTDSLNVQRRKLTSTSDKDGKTVVTWVTDPSTSRMLAEEMKGRAFTEQDIDVVMAEAKAARQKWQEAEFGANIENRVRALEKSQERAQKLAVAADDAERAAGVYRANADSYKAAKAGSRTLVREVSKELREARKMYRKVSGSPTVEDYVDDLIFRMTERLDSPTAIDKESVIQGTGRLKERVIKLTPEQRKLAEETGMLNTDLFYLRDRLYREVAPRVALQERFGTLDPAPLIKQIRQGYADRVDAAQRRLAQVDPKSREAKDLQKLIPMLNAEAESAVKDVVGGFRRLLNQPLYNEDTTSAVAWGMGKLRQMSFLRFGAGFILNVLPDLSTVLLHGGAKALSPTMGMRAIKLLKEARIDPKSRELARLVQSMELVFHHSRSARMDALEDLNLREYGIGTSGTMQRTVTGNIDRALEWASEKLPIYTGMQAWNSYWKTVAGLTQLAELNTRVRNYEKLSAAKKAELAALGIGEHEAGRLKHYFEKYGEDFDGLFDPNANRWHISGGDSMEMHRVLRIAIRRVTDRAVMTPGAGDTPLLMSSQMGRTFLQLATFGFKTVNTFLRPATQRAMLYGDGQALTSMAMAMVLGGAVTAIRGWINGKDVESYTPKQWAWESLDRSGFFAYLSPYVDASAKLFGPTVNGALGADVFEPTSRYARNKWWESLAGPWLGTLSTAGGAASSAATGDLERLREQAFYLTPFNQVYRLGQAVYNTAQE